MKSVIKNIILSVFTIMEIGIIVGLVILDKLSKSKAGVNHHLMVKKGYYDHWVFTDLNKVIFSGIVLVIAIILIVCIIKIVQRKKYLAVVFGIIVLLVSGFLVLELYNQFFINKLAYPYIVLGTALILLLEVIKFIIVISKKKV